MLLSAVMYAKLLRHRNVNIKLYINQIYAKTIIHREFTNGYELCPSSSRFIFILIWVGVSSKACKR
jgi:hypothetical protein